MLLQRKRQRGLVEKKIAVVDAFRVPSINSKRRSIIQCFGNGYFDDAQHYFILAEYKTSNSSIKKTSLRELQKTKTEKKLFLSVLLFRLVMRFNRLRGRSTGKYPQE